MNNVPLIGYDSFSACVCILTITVYCKDCIKLLGISQAIYMEAWDWRDSSAGRAVLVPANPPAQLSSLGEEGV